MKQIIACEIFRPFFDKIKQQLPYAYTITYVTIASHNHPALLHDKLQNLCDETNNADEIILLYGICGNAIEGLCAKTCDMYVPRVHDCFAILCDDNYAEDLQVKNACWRCLSNMDGNDRNKEYASYIESYGKEMADYVMHMLYHEQTLWYVTFHTQKDNENIANLKETHQVEVIEGTLDKLKNILLQKDGQGLLHVRKGNKICCLYDMVEVMKEKSI